MLLAGCYLSVLIHVTYFMVLAPLVFRFWLSCSCSTFWWFGLLFFTPDNGTPKHHWFVTNTESSFQFYSPLKLRLSEEATVGLPALALLWFSSSSFECYKQHWHLKVFVIHPFTVIQYFRNMKSIFVVFCIYNYIPMTPSRSVFRTGTPADPSGGTHPLYDFVFFPFLLSSWYE